ncbi:DUF1900-domain-containing protein [Ascobolus immersus RN42]|uniref:Coronin n=1 Tax=Ascobolus immersus RN42 TaxID=1160509 RepID=A0A3N4IB09_ASCIM|nr:DUF1900-domain-containing protein [Ascobolus immersus RN42]
MAGRFVRASKYRHVFGRGTRKEQSYDNLHISKNAWDSNIIKVNPKYLSANWEASGGGAFAVIPLDQRGKLPEQIPLFRGHTATVLDTDWSPFNDSLIASGSDDGKVFIWQVPDEFSLYTEEGQDIVDVAPLARFSGHGRKVGHVLFNPSAENVLASSSGDFTIKIWDVEAGVARMTLDHHDIVQSLSFSANGNLLATTCRDKKLRVWDVRQEKPAHEVAGHGGAKNSRVVWMGELDRLATTGFSRMSDRQLGLWDIGNPVEPIGGFETLDSISGVCMPFWDDGTRCLYLAGKGDGNIRYYEYENDEFIYLSEYKSTEPQRGIAFVPRRGLNVNENEVMRAYKTCNDAYIEPISFIVPRRAETFQSDIFPPAFDGTPGLTSEQWFAGESGLPPKFDLETLYSADGATPGVNSASTFSPTTATPSASITSPTQKRASIIPSSRPISIQSPPSPVKARPASPVRAAPPPAVKRAPSPVREDPKPVEAEKPKPRPAPVQTQAPVAAPQPAAAIKSAGLSKSLTESVGTGKTFNSVQEQLDHITSLLEAQTMTIVSQNVLISEISKELDTVKKLVTSQQAQLNGGAAPAGTRPASPLDGRSTPRGQLATDTLEEKDKVIKKLEAELEQAKKA